MRTVLVSLLTPYLLLLVDPSATFLHWSNKWTRVPLIAHYKVAGVEARVHRSKRKRPANALKFDDTRAVVDFIVNYAEAYAVILPGRTAGHRNTDVKLLPTNCTKKRCICSIVMQLMLLERGRWQCRLFVGCGSSFCHSSSLCDQLQTSAGIVRKESRS